MFRLFVCAALLLPGCRQRESPDIARDRATEAALVKQIDDLKALLARAEGGEFATTGRIAIGIAEETSKALFDAGLPQESAVGEHLRVRIESAQPVFRGNNAVLIFQARAFALAEKVEARLEIAGRLKDFEIAEGKLGAGIEILHFTVLEGPAGDVGAGVLERMVRANLQALSGLLPSLEIPVHLEHAIHIGGLDEGVVQAKPGTLPLAMTLAEVIPVNQRLWLLLDVKAGPWTKPTPAAAEAKK